VTQKTNFLLRGFLYRVRAFWSEVRSRRLIWAFWQGIGMGCEISVFVGMFLPDHASGSAFMQSLFVTPEPHRCPVRRHAKKLLAAMRQRWGEGLDL